MQPSDIQKRAKEVTEWKRTAHYCPDGGCECVDILNKEVLNFWEAVNKTWRSAADKKGEEAK